MLILKDLPLRFLLLSLKLQLIKNLIAVIFAPRDQIPECPEGTDIKEWINNHLSRLNETKKNLIDQELGNKELFPFSNFYGQTKDLNIKEVYTLLINDSEKTGFQKLVNPLSDLEKKSLYQPFLPDLTFFSPHFRISKKLIK